MARAGCGETCSDTTTRGSGGKGREQKVTQTLGTGPGKEAFEDGWGGGMPAEDCPTGTGDLLATWAALRGVAPWAGGRVFRPSIRDKGK